MEPIQAPLGTIVMTWRQYNENEGVMKVGDLVRWKQADFISDDYGVVIEIPEHQVAESQFDSGQIMVTVLWNKNKIGFKKWRIKAHYLEIINKDQGDCK